jgi:hypothetical protein
MSACNARSLLKLPKGGKSAVAYVATKYTLTAE